MKCVSVLFAAFVTSTTTLAADQPIDFTKGCKTNPSLVGPCYTVHGRLTLYNGTPGLRIWLIGTHRLLGVMNDGDTDDVLPLPENIRNVNLAHGDSIYGNFLVCPFEEQKPGEMQGVCIESVKNYVIKPTK